MTHRIVRARSRVPQPWTPGRSDDDASSPPYRVFPYVSALLSVYVLSPYVCFIQAHVIYACEPCECLPAPPLIRPLAANALAFHLGLRARLTYVNATFEPRVRASSNFVSSRSILLLCFTTNVRCPNIHVFMPRRILINFSNLIIRDILYARIFFNASIS